MPHHDPRDPRATPASPPHDLAVAAPGAAAVAPAATRDRWRAWRWAALVAIAGAALWTVLSPAWALRPFAPQTAALVAKAYVLRRISPLTTLLALAAVAALAWRQWRGARWPARTALALLVLVAGLSAGISRLNHFELMFKPLPHPDYVPAASASAFVDPRDMVLAVAIGGDAAAYPVRQIAYHHVVLDTVGGTPVAVTY
jgi:Protein of unknown function (DUF3179)